MFPVASEEVETDKL